MGRKKEWIILNFVCMAVGVMLLCSATAADAVLDKASRFEIKYMEQMIDHHAEGVAMKDMCVAKASRDDLKALCTKMRQDESAEIQQMQDWLKLWYGITHEPHANMCGIMGILNSLTGPQFDFFFMQEMVDHHAHAVTESTKALLSAYHPLLLDMSRDMVKAQADEMRTMRDWMCQWHSVCSSLAKK